MCPPISSVGSPAITENLLKRKWSLAILRHLRVNAGDPLEILKHEPDITTLALNERLRTMHRYALIERIARGPRPRAVTYRLSPKGRRILSLLELVCQLDDISDHDPRTLEEIFNTDFSQPIVLSPVLIDQPSDSPGVVRPAKPRPKFLTA